MSAGLFRFHIVFLNLVHHVVYTSFVILGRKVLEGFFVMFFFFFFHIFVFWAYVLLVWLAFLYFTFELLDLWPSHKSSRRWKMDVLFRNFCWLICILPTFVLHDSWLSIHRWSEKWYIWLFASITSLQVNLYSYCHEQIWIILQNTSFSLCKKYRPANGKNSKKPLYAIFCF